MAPLDTAVVATHLLFAGVWTGSVVFVAGAVVPVAVRGDLAAGPRAAIADRLATTSRLSAVVLLLTGGHLAASEFTVGSLAGSTRGRLVVAMLALWLVLAGLVEVGASRLGRGVDGGSVHGSRRALLAASVVAGLLLVDAGILAAA